MDQREGMSGPELPARLVANAGLTSANVDARNSHKAELQRRFRLICECNESNQNVKRVVKSRT